MPRVVGVAFRPPGKCYWFDPGELDLRLGDSVVVETVRGRELGTVRIPITEVLADTLVHPLKPVLRRATDEDVRQHERNQARARELLPQVEERVRHFGLPMKLLDAEFTFDASQIIIYFTAENRVDFRELVRDLACRFKTRVQLHQVGARDHTRMLGGYGPCGRELCCRTFLSEFAPVSMRMAKDQSLFLNPMKFSGSCGKLMCCLRFEHELYTEARARLPEVGARVGTPYGVGQVVAVSVLHDEVTVELPETSAVRTFKASELEHSQGSELPPSAD